MIEANRQRDHQTQTWSIALKAPSPKDYNPDADATVRCGQDDREVDPRRDGADRENSVDLAENAEVTETWRNAGDLMDHPTTTVECAGKTAKALRALESWAAGGADEGVRTVEERLHRTNTTITFLHAPGDDEELISVRMTARINNRRSRRSWLARHLWNRAVATIELTKRWFDNEAMWLLEANRHGHIIKGALDAGDAGKTTKPAPDEGAQGNRRSPGRPDADDATQDRGRPGNTQMEAGVDGPRPRP